MTDQRNENRAQSGYVVLGILLAVYAAVPFAIVSIIPIGWVQALLVLFSLCLLAAAIAIFSESTRPFVISSLKEERYLPLYHLLAGLLLHGAFWIFGMTRPEPDERGWRETIRDLVAYRLLDRAMLFAVAYPILLIVAYWGLSGRDGTLGDVVLLDAADPYWIGPVTICLIVSLGVGFGIMMRLARASPRRFFRSAAGWLSAAAVVASIAGLALLENAVAIAGAVAGAVAGAFAGAVAVAFAVEVFLVRGRSGSAAVIAVGAPAMAVLLLAISVPWPDFPQDARTTFLFLARCRW